MTAPGGNDFKGAPIPDYAKLRDYLVAAATQDLGGADLTLEKRKLVVQSRLTEALAKTKIALSDSIRKQHRLWPHPAASR